MGAFMKRTAAGFVVVFALVGACSKNGDSPSRAPSGAGSSIAGAKPTTDEHGTAAPLPPPGTFQVDPTHSTVLFKVRHLGAGYVYGWFKDYSGAFTIDADPKKSHIELAVKAASVDTRDDERNGNIAGPDFLNAKQFPELTFKSTSVDVAGASWRITGDLTIRGVTKSVTFTAAPVGDAKDPQGKRLVGVEARVPISRGDFGVSFMPEVVGPDVELIIALEGAAG
jgi:polyisoprenoid-binding protein YceI